MLGLEAGRAGGINTSEGRDWPNDRISSIERRALLENAEPLDGSRTAGEDFVAAIGNAPVIFGLESTPLESCKYNSKLQLF